MTRPPLKDPCLNPTCTAKNAKHEKLSCWEKFPELRKGRGQSPSKRKRIEENTDSNKPTDEKSITA
jgi:hypothetical protein